MADISEIKFIIKSLIVSSPEAMTIDKLVRDFYKQEDYSLPYAKFGYIDAEMFLRDMPDIVKVYGNGITARVTTTETKKSGHIHGLVRQQKKSSKSKKSSSTNYANQRGWKSSGTGTGAPKFEKKLTFERSNHIQDGRSKNNTHLCQKLENMSINTKENKLYKDNQNGQNKFLPKERQNAGQDFSRSQQTIAIENRFNQRILANKSNDKDIGKVPSSDKPNGKFLMSPRSEEVIKVRMSEWETSKSKIDTDYKAPQADFLQKVSHNNVKFLDTHQNSQRNAQSHNDFPDVRHLPRKVETCLLDERNNTAFKKDTLFHNDIDSNNSSFNEDNDDSDIFFRQGETVNLVDLTEAIPRFATNDNVYDCDFPLHSVKPGQKIPSSSIPEDFEVDFVIKLFIAEIHNPFKFWFHIYKEDSNEFNDLMFELQRHYEKLSIGENCIPYISIKPGLICAALYDNMWHRAEIVQRIDSDYAKCFFTDFGTVSDVKIKHIKYLHSSFATLPAQIMRGSLSNIMPTGPNWNFEATACFLSLSKNVMLFGKIREIDRQNRVTHMILCNSSESSVIQINKELVDRGYALVNLDWDPKNIKKVGHRIHHPREDNPTFDIIESGVYPSLTDLIRMYTKGINYEKMYVLKYHHPSNVLNKQATPERIRNLPFPLLDSNPFISDIYKNVHL